MNFVYLYKLQLTVLLISPYLILGKVASPIPEYILGIKVLQGLWVQTMVGAFCPHVRVEKIVMRQYAKYLFQILPQPWETLDSEAVPYPRETCRNWSYYLGKGEGGHNPAHTQLL